ncbi:MAG: hypothetical protein Q4D57_04955 [Clostridia bacterium]|nr:hypothetical protein [Clostridia bacterium]
MGKQEELKQAVEALTDEDIAELAGGKLSAKGEKIAKIAGMVGGGLVGAAGLAAGVVAIAGEVKHKDGAYYFKEMFGKKKTPWDKDYKEWGKSNDKYVSPVDSGAAYGGED